MIDFNCKCFYCERPFGVAPYGSNEVLVKTLDHIIPRSKGGKHSKENIVDSCTICNGLKGSLSLDEFIVKINKRLSKDSINGGRLLLIIKNAKILLDFGSKNPNPKASYQTQQKKRRFKNIAGDVRLSVNTNTSRIAFNELAEKQSLERKIYLQSQTVEQFRTVKEQLSLPEPNFHYL